jgi:ankyrin repeat protein
MFYNRQLCRAVIAGNSDQIENYLNLGADINSEIDGSTPLMLACRSKNPNTVLTLLDHGADVHVKNSSEETAFLFASLYPNAEIIASLRKKGEKFANLLHELAHYGNIKELENEIVNVPIDVLDDYDNTALFFAAANGQLETVQWLLEKGASLTKKNKFGATVLLIAAANGHLEIVKWVVEAKGVSLDERDKYKNTALLTAIDSGHLEIVRWLVEKGASLEERDEYQIMPLLIAAGNGHLEIVKWLVEKGVSLKERDEYKCTALLIAADNGQLEIVKWLLENGASLDERDEYENTALLLAAAAGELETVQWLVKEKGAFLLKQKNNNGSTALLLAAEEGQLETVQWLLENGAFLNERDVDRSTELLLAAQNGRLETVQWLVKNGAADDLIDHIRRDEKDAKALFGTCDQHLTTNPNDKEISSLREKLLSQMPQLASTGSQAQLAFSLREELSFQLPQQADASQKNPLALPSEQVASIFRKKWIFGLAVFTMAAVGILFIFSGAGILPGISMVATAIGLSAPLLSEIAIGIGTNLIICLAIAVAIKKNLFDGIKNAMSNATTINQADTPSSSYRGEIMERIQCQPKFDNKLENKENKENKENNNIGNQQYGHVFRQQVENTNVEQKQSSNFAPVSTL